MIRSPAGFDGGDRIKRYLDYYQPSYGVMMLSAGQFSPALLFAQGEQGVWYDPSDMTTLFQDAAGTTPVTAVEQPVGRILDKSGRGNHASQATSASRPVLSARVNLLTRTEEFNDAVWDKGSPARVTISANSTLDPLGGSTADTMTETVTNSTHRVVSSVNPGVGNISNISFKVSCSYKASSGSPYALLALTDDSGNNQIRAWFDLTSGSVGTVANVGNGSGATATISAQANGFYLCTLSGVPATTAAGTNTSLVTAFVGMADADNSISYVGNTGRSVFIWGADLRVANAGVNLPVYQRVVTATDYDTTGFPMYLRFDGTDDSMATGTINPGSVDKAQVFAGVRKLSDAAGGVVMELSVASAFNDGTLAFNAPAAGTPDYFWRSKGTISASSTTAASYPAPLTSVMTGIGDIAGDVSQLRYNGAQILNITTDQGTGNYLSYPLYIGRRGGTTLPFNGHLYSLILRFSAANLDAATITATETWVNGKTYAY